MEKKRMNREVDRKIPPFHTLLIEEYIEICEKIKISLIMGSAEIYGMELKKHYPHYYSIPCSIPVYTWEGAQIRIESLEYENTKNSSHLWVDITEKSGQLESAPMIKYLQVHYNLITLRKLAFEEQKLGPRVAVVGSDQAASQNISKLLLNYSGKFGMNPIYIDLDPENTIFIDGSIGALEYEYRIVEDLYDRPNKICFYYGNRSIRSKSYLGQVKTLADCVMKKLNKEIKDYKMHGTKDEYPTFAAGLVIQCPRYKPSYPKSLFFSQIKQILSIFECTHLISALLPEIEPALQQSRLAVESIKGPVLEGTESFLSLPRPLKSKIERYFNGESIQLKYSIDEIIIYELMTEVGEGGGYCRQIDIREEAVSKNTIAVLHAVVSQAERQNLGEGGLYSKALMAPIACLARIFNIGPSEITLEVAQDHFLEEFRSNIWVTSVSDQ